MTSKKPAYRLSAPGLLCALGNEPETIKSRLLAGSQAGIKASSGWVPGRVVSIAPVEADLPDLPPGMERWTSRNARLMQAAYQQIETEVQAVIAAVGAARVGVVMGSSTSGIERGEWAVREHEAHGVIPPEYHYEQQEMGAVGLFLAALSGARGPAITVSTACSSSSKVFASARQLLTLDICDAVIVGGADSLCGLTLNGFSCLEAMSAKPCNPLSGNRDGITIGEAAACFLLTRETGGVQLLGIGESSDAHHMSAPDPSGRGAMIAMKNALEDAGLAASEIDYVNLHGTATPLNDEMESKAVAEVFGGKVPCSSTKALHGHTLGAAGALELALCWLALMEPSPTMPLPPHVWDGHPDDSLPQLRLVEPAATLESKAGWTCCLSNSFAFGGNNCCLIVGRQRGEA